MNWILCTLTIPRIAAVFILVALVVYWRRQRKRKRIALQKEAERPLRQRMLNLLPDIRQYVNQPLQVLIDALGTLPYHYATQDFGLFTYAWQTRDICIYADVKELYVEEYAKTMEMCLGIDVYVDGKPIIRL